MIQATPTWHESSTRLSPANRRRKRPGLTVGNRDFVARRARRYKLDLVAACPPALPRLATQQISGRLHEISGPIEQFERGEYQADAAARARLDALVDEVLGIDFAQSFEREGRPGAVTQQALQAFLVLRFDAYAGIERKPSAVRPGATPFPKSS